MKAALVTGGSSGIGLAIARMLRAEGYGLTLAARTPDRLAAAASELGALGVPTDVGLEDECVALVRAHEARFGRLDVLVNAAGVSIGELFPDVSVETWDLQLDVNLRGMFLVMQSALPLLKAGRGLVVNMASIAGTTGAPWLTAYAAAKAGVIALTRTFNAEVEEFGVRATALAPAFVDTPMVAWSDVPGERMIQPADCAELVRALLRLSPFARVPEIVVERLESAPE